MPGKLEIENSSLTQSILISLWSADNKEQHLQNVTLKAGESTSAVVKGGVKRLSASTTSGTTFWDGMIPSYGDSPIMVYPETNKVVYKDTVLVNTLGYSSGGIKLSRWMLILIALVIIFVSWYLFRLK